jgi:PAS domain S-box-containing protein
MNPFIIKFRGLFRNSVRGGAWKVQVMSGIGLLLTAYAAHAVKSSLERAAQRKFASECKEVQAAIEERLHDHEQILRSSAAFFADSNGVSREEFHEFSERQKVDQTLPGIQGLGFAQVVPRANLAEHLRQVRAEGYPEYRIWPEDDRETYTSIVYLEPFSGRNLRAFGYDMFTEPVRREAMERARDQDEAVLTGKVKLVQETDQGVQAGTLMYAPVYRMGAPHATLAERRAAILGWIYSPYRMNDLLEGILENKGLAQQRHIHLSIFDGRTPTPETLLYESTGGGAVASPTAQLSRATSVDSSGHQWLLSFVQTNSPENRADYRPVWLVLGGGTIISLLVAGLALSLGNTIAEAEVIAKRLTADLSQSEERWKFALEAAGAGVWDWNMRTGHLFLSSRWKSIMGHSEDEIGATLDEWSSRVHPEDFSRVMAAVQAHADGETTDYHSEYRFRNKDGAWLWVLDRGMVVSRDEEGRALRMIGACKDVSERKRVEVHLEALRQIQLELTQLATEFINIPEELHDEAINQSLAMIGRLAKVDRTYLFSYDFVAMVASNTHEWCADGVEADIHNLQGIPLSLFPKWLASHQRGEPVVVSDVSALELGDGLAQRPQGIRSLVTVPLMHDGECLGFLGFDSVREARVWEPDEIALLRVLAELYANFESRLAAERQAEKLRERLVQARDAAQAAAQAKSLFLANMSHEIRTPLNAVLGYAQIMQRECRDCPNGGRLTAISRSGEHLLELLTDLLELVRTDVHQVRVTPSDFDFYQVLRDVCLMFERQPGAGGLALEFTHSPEVPRFIRGDSGKVRQILVNLVGNAVKFTERGGVRVAATVQPGGGADGLVIVVEVEDSGCGIGPDEMERIFEIFEQVQSNRAISTGVGLGLPLSRRYARAMGGDVTAASKPGGGSRFRFWFSAQVAAGGQPAGRGEVRQVAPGQPARHLLVVDDEAENRAMLIDLLTTAGFTVKTAETAELALARLAEAGGVDLVLMDKRLPGMDGYQAIGRLRELPATRDLPVVVVTASGAADEQDLARAAGADGYLAKPVQRDRLLAEIGRLTGVEYVYEEPPAVAEEPTGLEPTALACVAVEQRRLLAQALSRGDVGTLRSLITGLADEHTGLASRLEALVEAYDYDSLHTLLAACERPDASPT